jgi:hypothetical protein
MSLTARRLALGALVVCAFNLGYGLLNLADAEQAGACTRSRCEAAGQCGPGVWVLPQPLLRCGVLYCVVAPP